MKKKRDYALPRCWNSWQKMLIFKKNLVILLLGVCFSLPTNAQAQKKTKVTLDLKDVTLNEVIEELKKQSDYDFFYNSELAKSKGKISVEAKNKEVKQLLDAGYSRNLVSMQGLGYKEIASALFKECTMEEAVYRLKRDTRHFAKRQMTWFRRERDVTMINKDNFSNNHEIVNYIMKLAVEKGICSCREG